MTAKPTKKVIKKLAASVADPADVGMELMELAAANLADGVDPIEVYKYAPQWAFHPMVEFMAEAYRRHQARHPEEYRRYLACRNAREARS